MTIESKLRSMQQEHLLPYLSEQLHQQIESLDENLFWQQRALILTKEAPAPASFEPFTDFAERGDVEDQRVGAEMIAAGKVACLLVAGGQGTRLGMTGPKGIYPISPIRQKSLFQLFAEKTVAASQQAGIPLSLAIMTSATNHQETVAFFEQNERFGLKEEQLSFFIQSSLPFLDASGNLVLEEGSIAYGPDGNGGALQGLVKSGIWEKWRKKGIEFLNFILVDNPLADPFDANLIGFHARQRCDVTVKCVERFDPNEKVGVLLKQGVVEYTEMPDNERLAIHKHRLANISLFCFSASFIENTASLQLPLHLAWKNQVWKFEKFIFDLLPFAKTVKALIYPREEVFAPLKKQEDVVLVKRALIQRDRLIFRHISGLEPAVRPFELSQSFYYPTQQLLAHWHQKPLPDSDYIDFVVPS